ADPRLVRVSMRPSGDSVRHLKGLAQLTVEATEAVVNATERVHRSYARRPFAVLERVEAIAGPVRMVENAESMVAGSIYAAIRAMAGMSGIVAVHLLDRLASLATECAEGAPSSITAPH
ncbi:MAG: hypothetical protein ABIT01_18535, partial [Thermoanaerobaculia bacterium]